MSAVFSALSPDLLRLIALRLDFPDVLRLTESCRRLAAAMNDRFWTDKLRRDYPFADEYRDRVLPPKSAYRAALGVTRTIDEKGKISYLDRWGRPHREDGPAEILSGSHRAWYIGGRLHREEGPAVEYETGSRIWYRSEFLHREDGPAVEYSDGTKYWYRYDRLHREDGPAIEYSDGHTSYFLEGRQVGRFDHR